MNITWEGGDTGYDPADLIIERFGLNYDFIQQNNLTWIDNLITGSKKDLASPSHKNYYLPYVQEYLAKVGVRKCEANALVVRPREAGDLVRNAIEAYVGSGALGRFKDKHDAIVKEIKDFRSSKGLDTIIERALEEIENS